MTQTPYSQILDSLMTAVIVLNDDLSIQHMNISAEMTLGVSGSKVIGKPIEVLFSPHDGTPQSLADALRENTNFTKRKATWKLHHQKSLTVDYSVTPNAESGNVVIEVQPLDRLLRISREEAMISSQETSRNLVRSMAHEIKNPLGGIRGAAQLLSRELNNEDLEEYTRIIIDETDRLRDLVDRMLGPHKVSQREEMNIHETLEHVMSVLRAETNGSIKLARDYDPSIPDIEADKAQLIQATLNIARNAMQALTENKDEHKPPPAITFTTRIQRRYTIGRKYHPLVVKASITDNGPGIAPDLIEDIFFPMITGRAEGTGLGLAIAQNLISQHNGLIECDSVKGRTEFILYLPLENQHA
ncbi:nitrogen regulation protein NR(II) [Teredinibacter franksiae]|uniref:nitrogen regulation protein NR(II) n=1 Tax=Teredinibacter franksiae TaxID=2761453 RepID=UPI0028A95291|nr:nitrogen regulation protein NR(II) [Teredinibacter franksiae]